jgi:hypothetical protein
MPPGLDDREYSSRDVQEAAGLTARQQNDWDGRGLLPHAREGVEGWRRFTPREIFVLMVCSEIRRQFGTPVERLKYVQDFMLQDGANHFEAAVELMDFLGVGVWLLTDFESTFIMDSELEFIDLWQLGFFGAGIEQPKAFALLPINPLVNRLLSCLKDPVQLEAHGRGYEIMRSARAMNQVRTREEAMVLEMIRSKKFVRVEVESPDGNVATIRTTTRPDPATRLDELLDEPYQRLSVVTKEGKVVSIEQEVTTKPPKTPR